MLKRPSNHTDIMFSIPEKLHHVQLPLQSPIVVLAYSVNFEGNLHGIIVDGVCGVDDAASALADLIVHPIAVILWVVSRGHHLALKNSHVNFFTCSDRRSCQVYVL